MQTRLSRAALARYAATLGVRLFLQALLQWVQIPVTAEAYHKAPIKSPASSCTSRGAIVRSGTGVRYLIQTSSQGLHTFGVGGQHRTFSETMRVQTYTPYRTGAYILIAVPRGEALECCRNTAQQHARRYDNRHTFPPHKSDSCNSLAEALRGQSAEAT